MENKAHPLQVMLSDVGFGRYEPRSYSGKGMYGKTCLAVVLDSEISFGSFIADILDAYRTIVEDSINDSAAYSALNDIEHAMRGLRSDGMGRGVVYYWPSIPFVE